MSTLKDIMIEQRYKHIYLINDGDKRYWILAGNKEEAMGFYENKLSTNFNFNYEVTCADRYIDKKMIYDELTRSLVSLRDLIDTHEIAEFYDEPRLLAEGE